MKKYIIIIVACFCSYSLSSAYPRGSTRQVILYTYDYTPPEGPRLELPQYSRVKNQEYHSQQQQQHRSNYHQQQQPHQHRSYQQQYSQQQNVPLTMVLTSQGYSSPSSPLIDQTDSDSVRLPLPLGVASINVGPLPLSKGVSYSERPGLTSYGTPYPQRIR